MNLTNELESNRTPPTIQLFSKAHSVDAFRAHPAAPATAPAATNGPSHKNAALAPHTHAQSTRQNPAAATPPTGALRGTPAHASYHCTARPPPRHRALAAPACCNQH